MVWWHGTMARWPRHSSSPACLAFRCRRKLVARKQRGSRGPILGTIAHTFCGPCPGRAAPLTRGAFSLMTYTSGSRRRWQPLLLPLQPAILRAHNTSVGTPLAGMNDLNLGIHLHKHTKQPTLLKTSLSCSVNYFVIKSYLARSPDSMGK